MISRQDSAEYIIGMKRAFIEQKLTPLLKAIDNDLERVSYETDIHDGNIVDETVTVSFKSGGKRRIDITGDSLKAAVVDIIRFF